MVRGIILLILAAGVVLVASPFVMSSLYIDQKGIAISGQVYAKRETVAVLYSGWKRSPEATIEYSAPDQAGVSFFNAHLDFEHYDALRKGQTVSLKYLRKRDIPTLPLAHILSEIHALPIVRLEGQRAFSGFRMLFTRRVVVICEAIAGVVILLVVWRALRWPGFWWGVGICVVAGVAGLLIRDFPVPTPRPMVQVRQGTGRVILVGRIDRLFEGSRERGVSAEQPVDVVGIEFVPAGRTEAVVAVDLIDAGSVVGLKENSVVGIEYEGGSPRTAYVQGATRRFVSRNLGGIVVQGGLSVLVLVGFFVGAQYLGRAWTRLIGRGR